MSKITSLKAFEILDSRGNPTVRVHVETAKGVTGIAAVPSGASTGTHEALELRDGDTRRYGGNGVMKAIKHIEGPIAKVLRGKEVSHQRAIDEMMITLDGTDSKKKLGANAILGVSLACAHAAAKERSAPLYAYMREVFDMRIKGWRMPLPTMNVINGGVHADSGLDIQEFMIIPQQHTFAEAVRVGSEVFHTLKDILKKKGEVVAVGDEGGFAPHVGRSDKALALLTHAISRAGYTPGKDVMLGLDVAASEFYKNGVYYFEGKQYTAATMIAKLVSFMKRYPIMSIEDPLAEDDWRGWAAATHTLRVRGVKGYASIVGDDLFVTNKKRLARGIDMGAANAILIKVNQVGTLSETMDTILLAKQHGYKISVSHRSGETGDTTIADLAVAVAADYLKSGSVSRSERVEKYNRVMEIEREVQ